MSEPTVEVNEARVEALACAHADLTAGFLEDPATDPSEWWAAAFRFLDSH